MHEMSSKVHIG